VGIGYCIDLDNSCTPEDTYSWPVNITQTVIQQSGQGYMRYLSYDNAGNIESTKSLMIVICVDNDGDGYGIEGFNQGCLYTGIDCNDSNANVHPFATEICNGIDDNCNGLIDETCSSNQKQSVRQTLTALLNVRLDDTSKKNLVYAIQEINASLGNLDSKGDKEIIWIDSVHILCKKGDKVFEHEKKAVYHLQKITSTAIKPNATAAINIIIQADRLLAQTALNEAAALIAGGNTTIKLHDYQKAVEAFNKAENETKLTSKIEYYKKAWKYVNKHCPFETRTCIESITVKSPKGEIVTATGDEVSALSTLETVFVDSINDAQLKLQTGCTKCLKVGQSYSSWIIQEIIFKPGLEGTMTKVCGGR
jgi:hypothetical protein